jgi:4a-hydroxytetrahydrobiopterin dehydratase
MVDKIDDSAAKLRLDALHEDWRMEGGKLTRRFAFKGFQKAVMHANAAAFLGDREGHHPDIAFGWGYCEVTFTTHDVGGLSALDFDCAAKLDAMVAGA